MALLLASACDRYSEPATTNGPYSPRILSIEPASGAPGTKVKITGKNFTGGGNANYIYFVMSSGKTAKLGNSEVEPSIDGTQINGIDGTELDFTIPDEVYEQTCNAVDTQCPTREPTEIQSGDGYFYITSPTGVSNKFPFTLTYSFGS
jgi:hypothetical protein